MKIRTFVSDGVAARSARGYLLTHLRLSLAAARCTRMVLARGAVLAFLELCGFARRPDTAAAHTREAS